MRIKVGDRVRLKYAIFKQLDFSGRREIAVVESIEPHYERCSFPGNGLHSFQNIHVNNLEKVAPKKTK